MKVKTLSALAGLGGALILSGESQAAYLGLGVTLHTSVTISGVARSVYRVYAVFDDANNTMTAVGGSPALGVATIKSLMADGVTAGTNFFNFGGGNSAPLTSYGAFLAGPNAEWDTFATIGVAKDDVNTSADDVGLTPGFPPFIPGNVWTSNNAAWFTAGPQQQGKAGNGLSATFNNGGSSVTGMGVLIAQLTVNSGQEVAGTVFVNGDLGGPLAGAIFQFTNQTFSSIIPAPGALALLGLAGLVGTRRRRA
jgi:uncharacterized protein (TIGR03382 family)